MIKQKQDVKLRIGAYEAFLAVFTALIILRLFVISVGEHGYYAAQAQNIHGYYQKINPTRGSIYITDRFSSQPYPVATNTTKDLVYAVPNEITDPNSVATSLGAIIGADPMSIYQRLTGQNRTYVIIQKQLTDAQSKAINQAKLTGIYLDQEDTRIYPEGQFLSQVLGFMGYTSTSNADKIGIYGLEKYWSKKLSGTPGEISTQADKTGAWITGSQRDYIPEVDGTSLQLTIDRSIQYEAEQVLSKTVTEHGADSGVVIVADPKTGAILAMANFPSFDPNQYNKVTNPSVFLNQATMENYEPGSTMKGITLSAALDAGVVTPSTTYTDTGEVDIDGYKIKNAEGPPRGTVPMTTVIDQSLNTGAIFVEQKLGNQAFTDYVKKFGFGKPTNIDLQENVGDIGTIANNQPQINFYTASFGQGITCTPLQMLQAYMVMANGGVMMQPYVVAKQLLPDGTEVDTQPKDEGQIISGKAAALINGMLVDDVENGFGKKAGVPGYYIAGKTGTAQVAQNGKYLANDNIGSFVGYGPAEDPKFAMIVVINHPRDVSFAETTAAPAWGQIASFILNYYNIPTTRK
ncbi:penicillin-binding protein 2 [Patescibacteria group bacterium]|nr:penicillin-binding protein 2 [Patescibacteria group bacterium]